MPVSWLAWGQDRVAELLVLLERIATALERIADQGDEIVFGPKTDREENA